MQTTNCATPERHDVVNVMQNPGLFREPYGLLVHRGDLSLLLFREPRRLRPQKGRSSECPVGSYLVPIRRLVCCVSLALIFNILLTPRFSPGIGALDNLWAWLILRPAGNYCLRVLFSPKLRPGYVLLSVLQVVSALRRFSTGFALLST